VMAVIATIMVQAKSFWPTLNLPNRACPAEQKRLTKDWTLCSDFILIIPASGVIV